MTATNPVWPPTKLTHAAAAEVLGAIVEAANVAIIGVDLQGRVVSWNRAATELYGWSEAEVLGRKTEFLAPDRFLELHRTSYAETFLGGREHTMETIRRRKDGAEVAVSLTAFPIKDAGGRIVGGASISRDITDERATKKALEESEARFRVLFQTMSDGVVLQNGRGEVVSFNQRALDILHVTETELRGTTGRDPRWRPIFPDGTPCPPAQHPPAVALRTGRPVSDVLLGLPLSDGQLAWVLVNATPLRGSEDPAPTGVVVTFADFTRQKAALDALSESEARFRMALSTIQTGVFLSDGQRLFFVNDALCSMLGYPRDELLAMEGRDFESILAAEDLRRVLERGGDLLGGGDVSPTMEVQATRRDGSQGLFELRATLLPTSTGAQLLVAVLDLTERATAARLKDELLGLVSHELRTPLTTLLGNAQMLTRKDRTLSQSESRVGLREIQRDAQRLEQVLENMMMLSQTNGTAPSIEPLLLQRVIPEVVREQHKRVEQQKIQVSIEEDLPPVMGHAGYVRQVLLNLFSNAAKYAGVKQPVELDVQRDRDQVRLTVSDRGPGIDVGTMARVFEPFYRAGAPSRRAPGMGLGLTVCKRLVELQDGQITVASREGGGTSFSFTLPLVPIQEG